MTTSPPRRKHDFPCPISGATVQPAPLFRRKSTNRRRNVGSWHQALVELAGLLVERSATSPRNRVRSRRRRIVCCRSRLFHISPAALVRIFLAIDRPDMRRVSIEIRAPDPEFLL